MKWLRNPSLIVLTLSLLATALFFLTWKKWIHAQIDVGFHLYTAWRMSEGARLYRDLAYSYGPLSPWVQSILIRHGGIEALAISFFAASLGILAVWVFWSARAFSSLAAWVSGLVLVGGFFYAPGYLGSNYSFFFPYRPEMVHGLFLLMLALVSAARMPALAGAFAALLLGTSLEFAVAGAGWLAAWLWWQRGCPRRMAHALGGFAGVTVLAYALSRGHWLHAFTEVLSFERNLNNPFLLRSAFRAPDLWNATAVLVPVGILAFLVHWRREEEKFLFGLAAALLLIRIAFAPRWDGYGVHLTALAAVIVWAWGVQAARSRGAWALAAVLALTAGFLGVQLRHARLALSWKTHPLEGSRDWTYVDRSRQSLVVSMVIQWVERNTAPFHTVFVLPEGDMVNYLAGRSRGTAHAWPWAFLGQESRVLEDLIRTPPHWVVVLARDLSEYGWEHWGEPGQVGAASLDWLRKHYREVAVFESDPRRALAGATIWRRRDF